MLGSLLKRYGFAVLLSGLALILTLLLQPLLERSIFVLFITGVAISALYGGLGPGLFAALLSALASAFFLPPLYSLLVVGLDGIVLLVMFLLVATTISWLVARRRQAEQELRVLNEQLEKRVRERTLQQEETNKELESFAYSVSHDLRAPIRHIEGFAQLLEKSAGASLDETGQRYLKKIMESTQRAGALIDDLLSFSRLGRTKMQNQVVDMRGLVMETLSELKPEMEGRDIDCNIGELPEARGDPSMLRVVVQNLLDNAVKYTRTRQRAVIEVGGSTTEGEEAIYFVRDNGVGFDMAYADKLFDVFQRLHAAEEFRGTGIGLANVRRIVERHGGRVWAEGQEGSGATFYFSLPTPPALLMP